MSYLNGALTEAASNEKLPKSLFISLYKYILSSTLYTSPNQKVMFGSENPMSFLNDFHVVQ